MILYLLRHAEAVDRAKSDAARELTEKGMLQARKVGKFCARNEIEPDLILSSPLRRAEQTARLASEEIKGSEVEVLSFLESGMQPEAALNKLKSYAKLKSVMIVGHEPDFSRLICAMIGIASEPGIHLRKASLTMLTVRAFRPGAATLEFAIPVKLMK